MSKPHMLAPESQETYNLYTIHKQGLPGYRYLPESSSYVVLFPDDRLGLAPLRKNILHQKRNEDGAEYSREILDVIPASKIAGIPIPLLGPFFSGQCAGYLGQTIRCSRWLPSDWLMGWIWMKSGAGNTYQRALQKR